MSTAPEKRREQIHEQKLPPVAVMRLALKVSNLFRKLHYRGSPPPLAILEMSLGHYFTGQMLIAMAQLGIADHLRDGARSSSELARLAGVDPGYLYRVLRALTCLGVFGMDRRGRFRLNSLSRFLTSDHPASLRPLLLMAATEWHKQAWDNLAQAIITGQPSFEQVYGVSFFEFLEKDREAGATFNSAMSGYASQVAAAVVAAYDFSRFRTLVDVGGGIGNVSIPLLKKYPGLHATIFDLPSVVDHTRDFVEAGGLQARCDLVGGDFFESVPAGADAYLVNNVLHDWSDERCLLILASCRRAMGQGSTLLVSEQVLPGRRDQSFHVGKFTDLEMGLFFPGARERTLSELGQLVEQSGFALVRTVGTPSFSYVVECKPST